MNKFWSRYARNRGAVIGLVLLAYASPGSTIRGMMVGGLGLLCGMVGFDSLTDIPRFTFDSPVLEGGIELVPLCVGSIL